MPETAPQLPPLLPPQELIRDTRFIDASGTGAVLSTFAVHPLYVPFQLILNRHPGKTYSHSAFAEALNVAQGDEPARIFDGGDDDVHNYLFRSGTLAEWVTSERTGQRRLRYRATERARACADQLGVVTLAELAGPAPLYHLLGQGGRPFKERPYHQEQRRLLAALHMLAEGSLTRNKILNITNTADNRGNTFILEYPLGWNAVTSSSGRGRWTSYELASIWNEPVRILAGGLERIAADARFSIAARRAGHHIVDHPSLFRAVVQKALEYQTSHVEGLPVWANRFLKSVIPRPEYSTALARAASLWSAGLLVEASVRQRDFTEYGRFELDALVDLDLYDSQTGKFMSFAPELRRGLLAHELAILADAPVLQEYLLFGEIMSHEEISRQLRLAGQVEGAWPDIEARVFQKAMAIMREAGRARRDLQT